MKIRVGFGLGVRTTFNDERFAELVDGLESLHFDSLWLSERIGGDAPDPVVAMAFAAGRTQSLKFGTSVMVLPGRNPVLLAKELATLDRLSGGRLLPAFGLGVADAHEQQAFGVAREERAAWFDEALPLLRRFWLEDRVDHDGPRFHYEQVHVIPKPKQQPPDVWLGGFAPSELRRVGRLADGWLPSFMTAEEAGAARVTVEEVADSHGRTIDPEHFGALLTYADGPVPESVYEGLARRRKGVDPRQLVCADLATLRERIEAYCEHGFSKFVAVPLTDPRGPIDEHLGALADAVIPLQN
jgi:probable F420-dependent oxidoreductase